MKKISKLLISIFYTIIFSFSNVGYGEEASELAVAFYSDNDIDSALECLNSISDDTKSARDYLLLGNIYDEKGDKENALNFYKKAVNKNNKSYKLYYNIANLYADKKDYHAAIYYYKLALKYNNKNAYINYNLGCGYLKIGDLKSANSEFLKALKIQDDIPEVYYNLAYTYKRLGKKKQAIDNLNIYNKMMELK